MVKAMRSREVLTEEDEVIIALHEEGMFELEDMSLEEKKQLLQAIYDSKQCQQHAGTGVEDTSVKSGAQEISSTTVETRNDDNIVVQIEDDSLDMEFLDLTCKNVQSSNNSTAVENLHSFNEDDDIVENSQPQETVLDKVSLTPAHVSLDEELAVRKPTNMEIGQHGLLMRVNVLNHRAEKDNRVEFYQERLAKLKCDRKNKCHRTPWYFDKSMNISRDQHYTVVLREMEDIAAMAAKRRLALMGRQWTVYSNPNEMDLDVPDYEILPYGLKPKEVPYQQVVSFIEKNNPKQSPDRDVETRKISEDSSSPKKILIKPRVVDLENEAFDENVPGPSSRLPAFGSFNRLSNSQETPRETLPAEEKQAVSDHSDEDDNYVDCPLCFKKFEKTKIEGHFDLCERSKLPELNAIYRCPLCDVNLPVEALREKHMEKCANRKLQQNSQHANQINAWLHKKKSSQQSEASDSGNSDLDEQPPVKKKCN